MKRRRWLIGGIAGAVCVGLALVIGCQAFGPGATTRLARHFDLADVSSEAAAEAGLAAKLPAGTPESVVVEFLAASGIGKDRLSRSYPWTMDGDRVMVCEIPFDPDTFGFVKESWSILFRFDERRMLRSIEAKKAFTGL